MNEESLFDFLNHMTTKCWKCKTDVDQIEISVVTDGQTSWMELCPDCYDYYQELKRIRSR